MLSLQDRGTLFFGPGVEVYEGMIIGESPRAVDMDVNPTREKKLTNMRSSTSEATEKITPPASLSLEQMLEFIGQDECLEVTPHSVRPRKADLSQHTRARLRSRGRD
jgi:GTP-binding protein